MKVKELIALLQKEDPEAQVECWGYDGRGDVTGVENYFYDNPSNKWVGIRNGLESEPSDYQKALTEQQILKETLDKIYHTLRDGFASLP